MADSYLGKSKSYPTTNEREVGRGLQQERNHKWGAQHSRGHDCDLSVPDRRPHVSLAEDTELANIGHLDRDEAYAPHSRMLKQAPCPCPGTSAKGTVQPFLENA